MKISKLVRSGQATAAAPNPLFEGRWDGHRITAAWMLALLPPLSISLYQHGASLLPTIAVSVLVGLVWQALFARLRSRAFGADALVSGLIFSVLVGATAPLWQLALAFSFGIVIGEQIFGGRGRNFLSPAAVAVAFLLFSFPAVSLPPADMAMALGALLAGLLLLSLGLIAWRVLAGAATSMLLIAAFSSGIELNTLFSGSICFVLVFLVCDPVAAACTPRGRWLYGLLAGALLLALGAAGDATSATAPRAAVFAALLAALFAPLIDQAVIALHVRARRRHHEQA